MWETADFERYKHQLKEDLMKILGKAAEFSDLLWQHSVHFSDTVLVSVWCSFYFYWRTNLAFCLFSSLHVFCGTHPPDYSVFLSSRQELRLLAAAAHTHTHTLSLYTTLHCGTILSSAHCILSLPAGDFGNRRWTNDADLQKAKDSNYFWETTPAPRPGCCFLLH